MCGGGERGGGWAEDKIKITREKTVEGLVRKNWNKTRAGTNLNNVVNVSVPEPDLYSV